MVKLLTSISGQDFNYNYGETVELDAEYEQRLIETGQAERVQKAPKAKTTKSTK